MGLMQSLFFKNSVLVDGLRSRLQLSKLLRQVRLLVRCVGKLYFPPPEGIVAQQFPVLAAGRQRQNCYQAPVEKKVTIGEAVFHKLSELLSAVCFFEEVDTVRKSRLIEVALAESGQFYPARVIMIEKIALF